MSYVLIDGIDTSTFGMRVVGTLPPVQIPVKRRRLITIPGVSGQVSIEEDAYEELVKPVSFFYKGSSPEDVARRLITGRSITLSNERDFVFDYRFDEVGEILNTISSWHEFTLNFYCNPIKRKRIEGVISSNGEPVTLISQCNYESYPTISIEGSGNISLFVGEQTILLENILPVIVVDGITKDCYQGNVNTNNKMTGDFPVIHPNEIVKIFCQGNVTKMTVQPNWRWI